MTSKGAGQNNYPIHSPAAREPPSLRSEVERAIRHTARGKSTEPNGVPVELFKEREDMAMTDSTKYVLNYGNQQTGLRIRQNLNSYLLQRKEIKNNV